jgi:hypothetical protein
MKIVVSKFLILVVFLLGILDAFSAPGPPMPNGKKPPPPPGLPIDENLIVLFLIAILFGIYIIYNHKLKTKTPI